MRADDLKNIIQNCLNDVSFNYNDMQCGVSSEVHDYVPTFTVWAGKDYYNTNDINEVMTRRFFNNKSLKDIISNIIVSFI